MFSSGVTERIRSETKEEGKSKKIPKGGRARYVPSSSQTFLLWEDQGVSRWRVRKEVYGVHKTRAR
jgi:hypothetical protein